MQAITDYEGDVSCAYSCAKASPSTRDEIVFKWSVGDYEQTYRVRCDNALYRAPHALAPRRLVSKLSLAALAQPRQLSHCRDVLAAQSEGDIEVLALAAPKPLDSAPDIKILNIRGERIEHALCAHVSGNERLCHPGTLAGEKVSSLTPFLPDDLVLVDIVKHLWTYEDPPKKRLRGRIQYRNLMAAIEARPRHFEHVVALAAYHAESLRARREEREFDRVLAESRMEENPFDWSHGVEDFLLLKWRSSDELDGQSIYNVTPVCACDLRAGSL